MPPVGQAKTARLQILRQAPKINHWLSFPQATDLLVRFDSQSFLSACSEFCTSRVAGSSFELRFSAQWERHRYLDGLPHWTTSWIDPRLSCLLCGDFLSFG
jgi:hypothetical protein